MSGIAIDLPTIPGIVATFATCSAAKSFFTCSIIFASAKMSPSVRIAGLYDFGIRKRKSSSCWMGPFHSSIQNQETMRAAVKGFSGPPSSRQDRFRDSPAWLYGDIKRRREVESRRSRNPHIDSPDAWLGERGGLGREEVVAVGSVQGDVLGRQCAVQKGEP